MTDYVKIVWFLQRTVLLHSFILLLSKCFLSSYYAPDTSLGDRGQREGEGLCPLSPYLLMDSWGQTFRTAWWGGGGGRRVL